MPVVAVRSGDPSTTVARHFLAALTVAHLADVGTSVTWVVVNADWFLAAERNPLLHGRHVGLLLGHALLCYALLVVVARWAARRCVDLRPHPERPPFGSWLRSLLHGRPLPLWRQRLEAADPLRVLVVLACTLVAGSVAVRFAAAFSNLLLLGGLHHGADTWPGVVGAGVAGALLGLYPLYRCLWRDGDVVLGEQAPAAPRPRHLAIGY